MSKQTKEELEKQQEKPDCWGYQSNVEDIRRRNILTSIASAYSTNNPISGYYVRMLDIGAHEGWITTSYQAWERFGYEISDNAAARFPPDVKRCLVPDRKYDLITATGVMYGHYDYKLFLDIIKNHSCDIVIVSSIEDWEVKEVDSIGEEVFRAVYKYREFKQRTRVFKV